LEISAPAGVEMILPEATGNAISLVTNDSELTEHQAVSEEPTGVLQSERSSSDVDLANSGLGEESIGLLPPSLGKLNSRKSL
jgi:hypothetical protein